MNSRNSFFSNRVGYNSYYSKELSLPKSDNVQVSAYLAERNPSTKYSNPITTAYSIANKHGVAKEDSITMPNSITTSSRSYSRPSSQSKEVPRKISEEYFVQKSEDKSEPRDLSATRSKNTTSQSETTELKKKLTLLEQEIKAKDEKLAKLEAENKLLKDQISQARPRASSQLRGNNSTSHYSYTRNSTQQPNYSGYHPSYRTHETRSRTYFAADHSQPEGNIEESKTESRPEGMSEEDWRSIQLALRLETENMMMLRNHRTFETSRSRREAQETRRHNQNQAFDPNQPLDLNNINPDTMTYEQLLQLEERIGSVSKGLSKEQIKSIPKYEFKAQADPANEEDLCTICYSQYEEATKVRKLKCTHEFHSKCIKTWLKEHKTCPICKIEVI